MPKQQNPFKIKADNIARLAVEFFEKYDLYDYAEFSRDVAMRLYRKRSKPLQKGDEKFWAAAIVYALASVNDVLRYKDGLFSADDIAKYFGYNKKTVANKAYSIKDMLQMDKDERYISAEYTSSFKQIDKVLKDLTKIFRLASEKQDLFKKRKKILH